LTFLVSQIIVSFLGIGPYPMNHEKSGPDQKAKQPEIAPDTPGKEIVIQVRTRENQRSSDNTDNRQPAQITIQHIFERRAIFSQTFAPLYRIVESKQNTHGAENDPMGIVMKALSSWSTSITSCCCAWILKQPVNQAKIHSVLAPPKNCVRI